MNKEEYMNEVRVLEYRIELMKRLRCPLMAKKYERMLNNLKKRYEEPEE